MITNTRFRSRASSRRRPCDPKSDLPPSAKVISGSRSYSPDIARWLSRDPIGERGGLDVYSFVANSCVNRIDYLGLAWDDPPPLPLKQVDKCQCICVLEPGKCRIQITWTGFVNTLAGNVFTCGTAALVELKHAEGKNLAGCHLHQGVEVRTSLNPGVVMGDPDDYGSFMGAADPFYGGTWLFDTPMVQVALAPLEDFYHWFEAHDYVEENPSVENRFGFAGHARDPALAIASAGSDYDAMAVNTGFARWRNRQVPFFIPPIGMQNLDL